MSRYGWAFVNSIVSGAAVIGPDRGVVLNEGGYASASANFQFSGSTGSLNGQLNVTGNVTINGTLTGTNGKFTTLSASSTLDVAGNTIIAGNLTVNGNTTLGDLSTDIVTVTAQITGSQFDINGGTIDGTTIATSNITVGSTKTLDVSAGTLTLAAAQIGADKISGATFGAGTYSFAGRTITDLGSVTTADINGGTIDNTTIGVSTQSSGKFTTLSASSTLDIVGNTTLGGNLVVNGNVTLGNAVTDTVTVTSQITGSQFDIEGGTINNTTVGATTQASGRFTTLSASSTLNVVGVSTLTTLTASSISSSGGAALATNLTVGGNLTVSGNTIFGNASSDTVTVTAQITGSQFDIEGGTINNTSIGALTQSSGKFTTLSASSDLQVGGNITGSNLLINAIFGGVRSKTFTGVSNVDTTTDSDFIMLYGTATTTATVTLHNAIQSGKILIIRKTSNLNNMTLTCSVGGVLFDKDNANTAGTGIVMTAGTETNKMFVNSGTNWYEIFAGG